MLQTFIDDVGLVVGSSDDQHQTTNRVAQRPSALPAGGFRLPPEFVRPAPDRHVTYPLYIAPAGAAVAADQQPMMAGMPVRGRGQGNESPVVESRSNQVELG
jgi:hypothetical protein